MKKALSVIALVFSLVAFSTSVAMAERVTKSFNTNGAQTLLLQNLFANVTVKVGSGNSVAVVISGDKKSIKDIAVRQDDAHSISVKGKEGSNNIVMNGNSVSISTSGDMSSVVINGGDVIINGKRVTTGKGNESVNIEITVPKGTNLDVFQVLQFTALGLNGKLNASVSGSGKLNVSGVVGMKLKCSGSSECKALQVSGDVRADASGSSDISIYGSKLLDVDADASGASEIMITGNCRDIEAEASGASEISLHGRVSGRIRQNSSGSSDINIR